ncbi:MAG: glycerophosphodiester phosphodiesterase family protein [Planctomycetota bacterium]
MKINNPLLSSLGDVMSELKANWMALVCADLLVKALVVVVVAPLTALAWRLYLVWTGKPLLTDAEIAGFFAHPLGWVALLVLGGAGVATLAIGLGAMVRVVAAPLSGGLTGGVAAVVAAVARWSTLFRVSAVIIGVLAAIAVPFLAGGYAAYRVLLTEYDINYYLADKPPEFYLTAGIVGVLLTVLGVIWLWLGLRWVLVLPLVMLEDVGPIDSLRRSAAMTRAKQWWLLRWGVVWLITIWIVSTCLSGVTYFLTRLILDKSSDALWVITLVAGGAMIVWAIGQLLVALVISMSLAIAWMRAYRELGGTGEVKTKPGEEATTGWLGSRLKWMVVGLTAATLVALLVGAWAVQSVSLEDRVTITAHRGASLAAPENTMQAFELAIDAGADFIELDVQETKDGRVAVVHDQDLVRFGGPATKIWDATLAELQSVDFSGEEGSPKPETSVPELGEVLETVRGRVKVNIELKYYGHDVKLEQRVIDLVEELAMADQVVVMSLKAPAVEKVRALRPEWTVGLLAAKTLGDLDAMDIDFLAVHHGLATRPFIRRSHDRGQEVHAWTVNDPVLMSSLISRGVDVLITDDPATARRVLEERSELSLTERVILDLTVRLGLNQ